MDEVCRLNQRVYHRAWKRQGIVIDFPFECTHLSNVTIKWDCKEKPEEVWIPSLAVLEEEEEFDWE